MSNNRRRAFEDKITNPNFRRKINVNNTGSIVSKNDNPYEDYNNQKISSLNNNPNAMDDPFGTKKKQLERQKETPIQRTNKIILNKLKQARQTGTIDISNMKLTIIPQEVFDPNVDIEGVNWWEMVDINKLDASNNLLSENSFNEEEHSLSLLSYLISLRFSNNKFTAIPNSLYKLSNLKLLDLSGNAISQINDNLLKGLSSLVELDLSKNKLQSIPESIQFLPFLEVLRVSNNQLLSIPNGLGALTRLKKLYLNENSLQFLPPNLFSQMIGLEEIYLYKNRLENICDNNSSTFDNMKHLKFLDIHSNYLTIFNIFTEMPILDSLLLSYNQIQYVNGLDKCYNLTNLDLNNNKIVDFPPDILKLKKLTTLNLQNNDLNGIPNTLGLMNSLVRLNIEGNPLKRLVGKMRNCSTEELKNYLKSRITDADFENTPMSKEDLYDINDNMDPNQQILHNIFNNGLVMKEMNLKNIPVDEMQNSIQKNTLNKIDFSVNQINDISNLTYVLNRIESISELNLSQNLIDKFPLIILSLPNLTTLNLSKNKLKRFPYDEFTSTNLNDVRCSLINLDLSFNYIDKFPDVIGLFQNISTVNLASNNITFIDNVLNMKLLELDTLNLSDNKVEKLPNKLYKIMPKLKTLLMGNNNLRDIPTDVCLMKLANVNFYGNQIRRLRSDALTSATALLSYLRKIHVFDEEDQMNDNNNNNNNFSNNNFQNQQNQRGGNNFNNNYGGNNPRQKSGYKNMEQPNYHNTHGYDNNNYGNNNYNRGFGNQMNNNNYEGQYGQNNIINNQYNNNNQNNNFYNNNNNQFNNNQFNNNQNNNYYNKNNNQFNRNQNNNYYNQDNNNRINQQFNNNASSSNSNSGQRTLDDINKDIASLEEEMSVPTLPQYQKAALRKKYHGLLVERSKFLK